MFVTKDSNSENFWRQTTGDVVHLLNCDLTNGWREHKAHGVGAERYCQQCIVFIRNAADFDEHRVTLLLQAPANGGTYGTHNSVTASAIDALVTRCSPTKTAWYPAALNDSASACPRTPDSATRTHEFGMAEPMRTARS